MKFKSVSTLKYKIYPEINLVVDCWFGELTADKIVHEKLLQAKDPLWSFEYDTIADIRNTTFSNLKDEIDKVINYSKRDHRWTGNRRTAHITSTPDQVVFQMLLRNSLPKTFKNSFALFSTLEVAFDWLTIPEKEMLKVINDINQIISEQ